MRYIESILVRNIAIGLLVFVFGAGLVNAAIKEGSDYVELKTPIENAENTVIELYSYACPFCFKYSKILTSVITNLPKDVQFIPYHLEQVGTYGKEASQVLAVLCARDNKAGISLADEEKSACYKAQKAYFNEYHNNGKWHEREPSDKEAFILVGLSAAGVSIDDFNEAVENDDVKDILDKSKALYETAKIQGVPAFIVNGKYLIYTKSISSLEDLEAKIEALLKL